MGWKSARFFPGSAGLGLEIYSGEFKTGPKAGHLGRNYHTPPFAKVKQDIWILR